MTRPTGRTCAVCHRPGGQLYNRWVGGRREQAYVHRPCLDKWRAPVRCTCAAYGPGTCPACGGHLTRSRGAVALPERLRFTTLNENVIENEPRPATVVTCDCCDYADEEDR